MASYETDQTAKAARPTITGQLDSAEMEIKRLGRMLRTLQSEVETLYNALGIPMPPELPEIDDDLPRLRRA